MANNKLVNGDVLQALITELEKRSIGSLESTGSAITIKDLAGNTKDTLDVSIPSFTGATDSENGTSGLVPIPTAGKQDMALCGDATFKVLPISGGGTGASDANGARTNLGLERFTSNQNYTDLDSNYTATPTSGMSLNFFGDGDKRLWGAVLNFVFGRGTGSNENNGGQLIMCNGDMGLLYRTQDTKGGTGWGPLRQVAFKNDLNGIVAANLAQNGYVKFSNGLILQWGVVYIGSDSEKNISFNVSFSSICYGGFSTNAHTLHLSSDAGTSFYNITKSTATISHTSNYDGNVFWLAIGK